MTKVSGFWVLYFLVGTALVLLSFSSSRNSSSVPEKEFYFFKETKSKKESHGPDQTHLTNSHSRLLVHEGDMVFSRHGDSTTMTARSRKLKEKGNNNWTDKKIDEGRVDIDDYRPLNPVPSSKASVEPGPIEHGTPLNPYIPKPAPPGPGHLKNGGST